MEEDKLRDKQTNRFISERLIETRTYRTGEMDRQKETVAESQTQAKSVRHRLTVEGANAETNQNKRRQRQIRQIVLNKVIFDK